MSVLRAIKFFLLKRRILRSNLFDTEWYLTHYPEVKELHIDPVKHYLEQGWKEGKNPSEWFDTNKYLFAYPDVRNSHRPPLKHYLRRSKKEGRLCYPVACNETKKVTPTNDTPLISIIVASYNYAHLLPETLDSLLAQTYTHYEIIVVDDGSSDNSLEVIERYCKADSRIHLLTHPGNINRGLPATVRLGIEAARGEYIAFCESDDIWMPCHLEKKVAMINAYNDVKIISNHVRLFGDDAAVAVRSSYILDIRRFLSEGGNRIDLFHRKEMNYIPTFSAVMIRRDALLPLNFDSPIPAWIDFWLYRQLLKENYLYYVPEPLTGWRLHESYNGVNQANAHVKATDWFLYQSDRLNGLGISQRNAKAIQKIRSSKYFDEKYYRTHYGTALNGTAPAAHYLFIGWKKGYNPSAAFSNDAYLAERPGVWRAEMNPLLHYELHGKRSDRILPVSTQKKIGITPADTAYAEAQRTQSRTVLLVSHELSLTGAPRALLHMATCLKEAGATPVILSLRDGKMRAEIEAAGIRLIVAPLLCIKMEYRGESLSSFFAAFDVIVLNTLESVPLIKYMKGVPARKIAWLHEGSYSFGHLTQYTNFAALLPQFDKLYCVGDYARSFVEKYVQEQDKLGILLYGLPETPKQPSGKRRDTQVTMLLPGSLEERKGQLQLLQALKLLPRGIRKQLRIYLAGHTLDRRVRKAVRRCHYRCLNYVGLLDHAQLLQLLSDTDVVLTPSLDDPMPIVCTEAMMYGIPVIVSRNTGTASFIQEGINGYTIPAGDPAALAHAIEQAVTHRELLPRLGSEARRVYEEHFTMEVFKENIQRAILGD